MGPGLAVSARATELAGANAGAYASIFVGSLGIDPLEIVDLVLGFVLIDLRDDDL